MRAPRSASLLRAIGELRGKSTGGPKGRGLKAAPVTAPTAAPTAPGPMYSSKPMVEAGPPSPTQATLDHDNMQAGSNRPPTFQESRQIQAETAASPQGVQDYSSAVEFSQGYRPSGFLDRLFTGPAEKNLKSETERLLAAGDIEGARKLLGGKTGDTGIFTHTSDYATAMLKNLGGSAGAGGGRAGAGGGSAGQGGGSAGQGENPFVANTVMGTYRPRINAIEEQALTEADQQVTSEEAQKEYAQGIDTSVQDTQQRTGENIEGFQAEATAQHDAFTQERQALSRTAAGLGKKVEQKFDAAIAGFQEKIDAAQGILDVKESAALAGVMEGKASAMMAAVQGTQGQVNSQVAQINANPNLTAGQKAQMTAQVKMTGAASMGPQVGATVLEFNKLAASTAVAFGNMTTSVQTTGLQGTAGLMEAGLRVFADTHIAAANLGGQLLQTQANADNNYITAQANMESTRANIDMMGDQLRASLIPEMGVPYPDYANVMATTMKMDVDLANLDFKNQMGRYGAEMASWAAAQQARGGIWQTIAAAGSTMGGMGGTAMMGLGMIGGAIAQGSGPPAPSIPGIGGYQPGQAGGSFFG